VALAKNAARLNYGSGSSSSNGDAGLSTTVKR